MTLLDFYRLAEAGQTLAAGAVTKVMLFPIGNWTSNAPRYRKLPLTREMAEQMVSTFDAGVLETGVQFSATGMHGLPGPAAFWVEKLSIGPYSWQGHSGEALWADVKWTQAGADAANTDEYRYLSIEAGQYTTNTGTEYPWVLQGGVLTNKPVMKIMPPLKDAPLAIAAAEEPREPLLEIALSEIEPADPVAELIDDIDALLAKLDDSLKGKAGIRAMRTMLREARAKASAHALSEDPEPIPPLSEPPVGATAEPIGDGASDPGIGQSTPPKESKHMSELTELLKLSEDADESLMLAEVQKVITERDTAVAELSESKRTAVIGSVTLALDEAIKDGRIAPAERDGYLDLSEADADRATKLIAARQNKIVDLGEHGSGAPAVEPPTYADPSIELAARVEARMAKDDHPDYGTAMSLVLADDASFAADYVAFTTHGKEA